MRDHVSASKYGSVSSTTQRKQRMAGVDILASAFSGANAAFLGEQYARWAANPASVDPSFAELFGALNDDARAVLEDADRRLLGAAPSGRSSDEVRAGRHASRRRARAPLSGEQVRAATIASLRALMLIRSYRVRGHLEARLDPLGLQIPSAARRARPALLRLHRRRPRQADLHRQRARPRNRDAARDPDASCARPIAARSASSSCTSRTPTRSPGSSAGSKARPGAPRSTPRRSAPSCSS